MFKLLGFIIGSAVSIGGILLVLGVPELHVSNFESDQARFDAALQKIRDKQTLSEPTKPPPSVEAPAEQATEELIENIETQLASDFDGLIGPTADESVMALAAKENLAPEEGPTEIDYVVLAQEITSAEQRWQDFWNPFRSEIAARGFVTQLERVTGLDYRIIKIKAGEYQVAFAYQDDSDRQINIEQISAATGLEFPEI